ncbi:MAG TPA: PsiF family protein [Steroidobacteraceae bacterium]|nr:PsiF family protein [Steroidobacteraceae bacterium]
MSARIKFPHLLAVLALCAAGGALAAEPPASPSATPIKHTSSKACNKQADAKKLTGEARAQFLKNCTKRPEAVTQ